MRRILATTTFAAALSCAVDALAVQRTFVASNGIDTNPCTLQLPCRAFAAAILLTDANGEIIVLDSAGYGPVTITKPVAIIAPQGVYAGISVLATFDGITVNAGVTDKVVLRGLTINGQGGNRGIVVTAAGQVHVEQCTIANMGGDGIVVNGGTAVYVSRGTIRSNTGHGLHVAAGTAEVYVDDTRIANNVQRGILAEAAAITVNRSQVENNGSYGMEITAAAATTVRVEVRDSLFAGNGLVGISAVTSPFKTVNVTVAGSAALRNAGSGFSANTSLAGNITFVVSNSVSNENGGNGLFASGSGTIVSLYGNTMSHNGGIGVALSNSPDVRTHNNNGFNNNFGAETSPGISSVSQL